MDIETKNVEQITGLDKQRINQFGDFQFDVTDGFADNDQFGAEKRDYFDGLILYECEEIAIYVLTASCRMYVFPVPFLQAVVTHE